MVSCEKKFSIRGDFAMPRPFFNRLPYLTISSASISLATGNATGIAP